MRQILFTDHKKIHLDTLVENVKNELIGHASKISIVMKPNLKVMIDTCERLMEYKNRIVLVIQINSCNTAMIKILDPFSPYFIDRLAALKYAFENGYNTSVEADPMIDNKMVELVEKIKEYVTDYIYIDSPSERYVNSFPMIMGRGLLKCILEFYKSKEMMMEEKEKLIGIKNIVYGENINKVFSTSYKTV